MKTQPKIAGDRLVNFLLKHNEKQSQVYSNPDAMLERRLYRAKHPTEIAAWKCMDGRLHLPIMTETPLGIIQPFRNIGGKFDLGWPFFGLLTKEWIEYAIAQGRETVILVTYHYSKSDRYLGCKGFDYDTEEAMRFTKKLVKQVERVFGKEHRIVYPIQLGIETDEDALIVHGTNGEVLDLSRESDESEDGLRLKLQRIFPDMQRHIIDDLLPIFLGNIRHIASVRAQKRSLVANDHKEQILGIGRGFDWLHLHNKALLVGPFSYNLADPIAKAAGILLENIEKKRIPAKDGVVLMASAVYRDEVGIERNLAHEKVTSLAAFGIGTIREKLPQLMPYLHVLVGTVDLNTRRFERIPFKYKG